MRQSPPDLVLLDLAVPELHGFTILTEMQAEPKLASVPVVILSAFTGRTMEAEAMRRGAARFLCKTDIGLKDIVKCVGTRRR